MTVTRHRPAATGAGRWSDGGTFLRGRYDEEPHERPWLTDDGTRKFVNGKPIGYCSNCVERCEGQHGPCYDEVIGCTEDFKPDGVGGTDA